MRVLRAGRGPVVLGGLAVFDPLEINAATLPERDKRDKGWEGTLEARQRVFVRNQRPS